MNGKVSAAAYGSHKPQPDTPDNATARTPVNGRRSAIDAEPLEREAELWDFLENAAVAMHWVGEDGTILWANRAEMEMLGYSPQEYIGHSIAEFHADQPVIGDILERLKSGEKLTRYESRLRCKDGSVRSVAISSSVYRKAGKFVHTRCVTFDITGQRYADELGQRLGSIIESSDDAIIGKDLNGVIQSWNAGAVRIFGYTAEEVIGKHISVIAAPDRVHESSEILARIARGERVDHYETKRRTKDGRILTVSLTVSPIRDAKGTIIGASKVARDITMAERHERALRAANEALIASNEDLQQFAYSASHDLQEPLRMVAAYSELLMRKFGDKLGPDGVECIGYTLQGALRMEHLLKALRAYTLSSTADQNEAGYIDADTVLDKVLETLGVAIGESGASITRSPLPKVRMHEFQLEQLFQNLIGNAIRYKSTAPPEIRISAARQGDGWLFAVADNGIGIDPKYKEQIFGLFKRLHSADEYPGSGMGLAICKRIVERAGGRIRVESEPGCGSTFYFTLP
jgi:hypothetical protein